MYFIEFCQSSICVNQDFLIQVAGGECVTTRSSNDPNIVLFIQHQMASLSAASMKHMFERANAGVQRRAKTFDTAAADNGPGWKKRARREYVGS